MFPYNNIPKVVIRELVLDKIGKMNYFPAKDGLSEYFISQIIKHKEKLDDIKHCQITLVA